MTTGQRHSTQVALALIVVVSVACARLAKFSYEDRLAIVVATSDKVCVSAKGTSFKPGKPVRLIDPGAQKSWSAVVESGAEPCEPAVSDVALRAARVQITGDQPPPFIGMAIADPRQISFDVTDGAVAADIDGDGQREFFRSCTSVEGVHLTVWSGAPLTGQRRWHAYHYVGYDLVPSCTPAEIGG